MLLLHDPVERIESQHRQGDLQDDERHGHSPELAVHWSIIEPQPGEPHEVVAPREEDGDDRSGHEPPFVASLAECKTKDEEEYGDCSHIHRAGRERLRAPVQRHVPECLAEVRLASPLEQPASLRIHIQCS